MDQRDAFLERATLAGGGIVPVLREVVTDADTPVAAFAKIARPPFAFLLESLVGGERWARYTFLGTEPREAWRYRGPHIERWTPATGWEPAGETSDPITHLADRMRALRGVTVPGLPRFMGGAVGYLGYDLVRSIERLAPGPPDTLGLPDAVVMIADSLVILDNVFGRAILVANVEVPPNASAAGRLRLYDAAQERLDALVARLGTTHQLRPLSLGTTDVGAQHAAPLPKSRSLYSKGDFERDVEKIRDYIAAGDVFQAVLSRRQVVPGAVDPLRLYRYLRALNPAPYLFYLALDDVTFVGSSPEVLVRVEGNEVTVRPIAGTRPRGASPVEDDALAAALISDAKELAEHRMLVDLGRNDVGRIAQYGTVRVTESLQIERYSHVQHLVSEVRGQLKDGYDALDVFRACFPAGTVSGAPKVRAMEIIDELEPERRGPYAGAVGYVGWGATTMDTCIAIRAALTLKDSVVVQAGAGIVADSEPAREFAETEAKAQAVLRALALAKAGD
jgi:anthranilate synthase component I